MGKRKISHAAYAAWDYKKEIEDLNKKSQEGWQLVKGGCFKSIYEQNDQACYRYQLDYNTDIENKVLYFCLLYTSFWQPGLEQYCSFQKKSGGTRRLR